MAEYVFDVRRKSPNDLTYEAVERATGAAVVLGPLLTVGEYPDIERYMEDELSVSVSPGIVIDDSLGDSFDQDTQTCTYYRADDVIVIVHDGPRTVVEISRLSEPF